MIPLHFSSRRKRRNKILSFPVIIRSNVFKFFDVISPILLLCTVIFGEHVSGKGSEDVHQVPLVPSSSILLQHHQKSSRNSQNLVPLTISPPPGKTAQLDSNVPDFVHVSLSSLCEKCSNSQRKKVEQILLLLFNFNSQAGDEKGVVSQVFGKSDTNANTNKKGTNRNQQNPTDPDENKHGNFSPAHVIISPLQGKADNDKIDKRSEYQKRKKALPYKKVTKKKPTANANNHIKRNTTFLGSYKKIGKFKVTSVPRNSPLIPTPEFQYYPPASGVIQLPTISTTPSSSSTHQAFSILPFYPSTSSSSSYPSPTLPFPVSLISTTMSSALEPVQSVEMPTPPMPPTTSGPIYLYYVSPSSPSATATVSSSLQPPTTPVVESSVASKPTTVEP